MRPDAMILVFWMLSFKARLFTLLFTTIKRYFSSSSLSTIRMVSSTYLRLLIFLLAILIPACDSSSLAFCMMYYITLPTKVCLAKAMVFPVVMYGCESWTIKKAEHWRIELCWRRLLRVRWTARRSNQSILKEISPEYSLEGLMLRLKLQWFGHLMWRTDSLEKTLRLGKIEGRRG